MPETAIDIAGLRERLPAGWRVVALDDGGVCAHAQDFELNPSGFVIEPAGADLWRARLLGPYGSGGRRPNVADCVLAVKDRWIEGADSVRARRA